MFILIALKIQSMHSYCFIEECVNDNDISMCVYIISQGRPELVLRLRL